MPRQEGTLFGSYLLHCWRNREWETRIRRLSSLPASLLLGLIGLGRARSVVLLAQLLNQGGLLIRILQAPNGAVGMRQCEMRCLILWVELDSCGQVPNGLLCIALVEKYISQAKVGVRESRLEAERCLVMLRRKVQ